MTGAEQGNNCREPGVVERLSHAEADELGREDPAERSIRRLSLQRGAQPARGKVGGGNPQLLGWSPSAGESRHQFTYNLFYNFFDAVRVNWFGQIRSGSAYTPSIAGDVNGDGYSNDRAFIYDPATTADPALAAAMRNLLANSTGSAREC